MQVLKQNKVASIIILVLVLSISFVGLNLILVQATENQKLKAETLLNILEQSNMSIVLALNKFGEQNITFIGAETTYNEGLLYAKEASNLITQENYEEASNKTVEAMQKFEETLRLLEANSSIYPSIFETSAEEVLRLKSQIARAKNYVDQIENLVTKATEAGYNTLAIERTLEQIKLHLATSERLIGALNLKEAVQEFSNAKALFDKLIEPLEQLKNIITKLNTERYLQEAEVRISAAKLNITTSLTLTPEVKEDAISALNNSEVSLANAKDDIENNEVTDAINELETAKRWEEESKNALSSATDAQLVNSLDDSQTNSDIVPSNTEGQP